MKITTFAAINIGSYEVEMKIFELSSRYGIKEIDHIRHRIELGKESYNTGKLSYELMEELCEVLLDYKHIMETYMADDVRVCATSAIREIENAFITVDQIYLRTGLKVEILSNSEQRFIGYKSIASKEQAFNKIIQKGTAIVDIGGGSIQISLFDNDKLVTTQNIKLGNIRIRERLADLEKETTHLEVLIEELIYKELFNFKKMFLKDREIRNMIMVGDDHISDMLGSNVKQKGITTFNKEELAKLHNEIVKRSPSDIADRYSIPLEQASLMLPSSTIFKCFIETIGIETIWSPGLNLSDGLAYDYAEKNKIIKMEHNFEHDIIAAARNISKRYLGNKNHISAIENICNTIFNSMKKIHGMTKREQLILQIAAILHGCGKYISLSNVAECSYNIIMSTEIIGLSHAEREVIANVAKFNTKTFSYREILYGISGITEKDAILITKLTAILRVANALDRSHKQKFRNIKAKLSDKKLTLTVDTSQDITLERGLFTDNSELFQEVYGVKIHIVKRKIY